ncbi:MAG: hypothetical protein K2L42_03140 [Clostridia bacterium]|nr:hypothetical protein [Clostridia bacterium]
MKLSLDGGVVVLSLEDKNKAYLSEYGVYFKGFFYGRLKMELLRPEEFAADYVLTTNTYWLEEVVAGAEKHGVYVDKSVLDKLKDMQAEVRRLCGSPIHIAEITPEEERWARLCEKGCGGCKNKIRQEEDYLCAACGEILPERNMSGYAGGIYRLFNYKPFPTDNCPFKFNKTKGVKNEYLREHCRNSG